MGGTIRIHRRVGISIPLIPFKLRKSDAFTLYDLSRSQDGEYGIKAIMREIAKSKMKPPACEAVWETKLAQKIRFDQVWKVKRRTIRLT